MGPKKEKSPKSPTSPKGKDKEEPSPPPKEEPVAEVVAVPDLPPGELPGPPPVVTPQFVYNKELTPEQLHQILALSVNLEDAARCLAGFMQLGDVVFDARNLILLEYCLGNLMFARNTGLSLKQTHVTYDIGHMILDIIRAGGPFADAERTFKNRVIAMSMKSADKPEDPIFTALDLQKITPYFTSTVFQHYCLYQYCFTKVHYNITREERVWIETAMVPPLSESKSEEELAAEEAARKEAAAKAEADALEAEAKAKQDVFAVLAADAALRAEEELKRKPLSLHDAIDMAVRDKVNQAKNSLIAEYEYREKFLIDKILKVQADDVLFAASVPAGKLKPVTPEKAETGKSADKAKTTAKPEKSNKKKK